MKLMSMIYNRLFKLLYWPICRAYAQHVLRDKPADTIMQIFCSLDFWHVHGYWPHFRNPRSFSEKICSRMLFDRNPRWTMISDKLRVRDYITDTVGSEYLIPLLWNGENSEKIPFDELPQSFVIKANHGCGYNIIVKDKTRLDQASVILKVKKWLEENFCLDNRLGIAWAYKAIRPNVIVESFIGDNGKVPEDYKFLCYSGRVEFIQMNFDRFGDPYEKFFDRDFNPLDLWQGTKQYPGKVARPNNYEDMVRVAECLSRGFDFIRVDLYNVGGRIYFGELTCYPAGGIVKFIPRDYDFIFGANWQQDRFFKNDIIR